MAKVVYNACFGGFGLSDAALELGQRLSGDPDWDCHTVPRHDLILVQVVEVLSEEANGDSADLIIREIPDGSLYRIEEYNGSEHVVLQSEMKWEIAS